jgi:NAD+ diphosphatase
LHDFVPAASALPRPSFATFILVSDGQLLCRGSQFLHAQNPFPSALVTASHYLGELAGLACGVCVLQGFPALPGCEWRGLRSLLLEIDEAQFALAGRALQVANWDRDHRFCGRCGGATEYHESDRARVCATCQLAVYPRISPCVIMLVTRGDECLLARHVQHASGFFTALAGFIEPGENAEQALVREVYEEVGLDVAACRYVGSQAWPFPGQLMLGYFAEWAGGELRLDEMEIAEAAWFHRDRLPPTPPAQTLSGQLIRAFAEQKEKK